MRQRFVTRRASVAVAALVIHGALILVAIRVRTPTRELPALPQFVSLWLREPHTLPMRVSQTPEAPAPPVSPGPAEPGRAVARAAEDSGSASPDVEAVEAPASIDWMREGSLVARSAGETLQPERSDAFSGPVPRMREACVTKETSFKWNPEEKRVGFSGGLPYVLLGNCVVGLGFFACPMGEQPPPNSHLFDDMVASNRQESSVPDADYCD
jgi:hypothetical protein